MKIIALNPLVIHFKNIDSTQNYLKRHYKHLPNLTFVYSDFQSSGKGRRGRTRESNIGENLLFSILIKDKHVIEKFDSLSIISGLLIEEVLKTYRIKKIEIKWPNDVYIDSKKVAGILLEGISSNNKINAIVLGVGLNVNQSEFNEGLRIKPTSMKLVLNENIDIKKLRKKMYKLISNKLKNIEEIDYLNKVNEINFLKNKLVSFEYNGEVVTGIAKEINKDNSLKILINNQIINVKSGEVNRVKTLD